MLGTSREDQVVASNRRRHEQTTEAVYLPFRRKPFDGTSLPTWAQKGWSLSLSKRAMDVVVSLCVLAAIFLPGILIYVAVRAGSCGPGFFRQKRIGFRGRPFPLYKFRTMDFSREGIGPGLTREGDPRVTAVGKWLRKLKLDELPQFYNVLRGEMSLVGPRPKLPQYAVPTDALFRPGITGMATILFRGEEQLLKDVPPETLDDFYRYRIKPLKARADFRYMRDASFFSDLRLLFLTVYVSVVPAARTTRKNWTAQRSVLAAEEQILYSHQPEVQIENKI
jgi:lipopolysaccharide/colanic/teichoic acid biosynthesis glycosyltransferase